MADNHYDAIVVGSNQWRLGSEGADREGPEGPDAERGRNIEHVKDYVNAMKEAWDFPHATGRRRR